MTIQTSRKMVQVVRNSGSDPVPSGILSNALEITEDSDLVYDQSDSNSQNDVASQTFSNRPAITGREGGTATLNGNLKSTDGTTEPAIAESLALCGAIESTSTFIELGATATNVTEGDTLDGVTSGAQGIVKIVDDTYLIVDSVTGTFQAAEDVEVASASVGTISSVSGKSFVYKPDSSSELVGSVFLYEDGVRWAIKDATGNITITAGGAGQLPKFALNLIGKKDGTNFADASFPEATYLDVEPPVFKCADIGMVWDGGSYTSPKVSTFEYNFGSTPVMLDDANDCTGYGQSIISSRDDAGGSIQIQATLLAEFNPEQLKADNTVIDLSVRLGDGTIGRTWYVRQSITFTEVTKSVVNNITMYDLTYVAVGKDLNDDESYLVAI